MLNKSYTLNIDTEMAASPNHPVTRVYEEHFLGTQRDIAVLDMFTLRQVEYSPETDSALLVGIQGDKPVAVTVDLWSGEVHQTLAEVTGPVHLFSRPAHWEPAIRGQ